MPFELKYTERAKQQFDELSKNKNLKKRFKAVRKSLGLLSNDPKHPSLNTHKYDSLKGPNGAEVFEAYAENKTAGAYRIFWCYHPPKTKINPVGTITILLIPPHP